MFGLVLLAIAVACAVVVKRRRTALIAAGAQPEHSGVRRDVPSFAAALIAQSIGLFFALLFAALGLMIVLGNVIDADARADLTPVNGVMFVVILIVELAPLAVAAWTLTRTRRRRGLSWPDALIRSAGRTGVAVLVSFLFSIMLSGGM